MARRIRALAALAAALCLLLSSAACAEQAAEVHFREVSVHDPSVMRTRDGRYYIYGSHMQAAWSDDLVQWKMFSKLDKCRLQPDYAIEFREALTWAKTGTFWAPDVIQLADGRYYMYYCCCEGSSPLSALGLAVSDSPEGPFTNVGILLKSGGAGYDATVLPNAIDPCVFYSGDGTRLYMVYGSYSGGIYLLELDPATGLILPGQEEYGIHLTGGNHSCIEAPYIVYNPETGYYYLFLSYGGLNANDGYNIRVCRSRTPEGPYEDAAGNDMRDCRCGAGRFFNNDDIAPYGTKLMGGYLMDPLPGENSDRQKAYRSPGHNSVFFDASSGEWTLYHHTRFAATGERYVAQVRRMFFNSDGWPVISPARYTNDVPGFPAGDAAPGGTWKLVLHGTDVNCTEHVSAAVTFLPDGRIQTADAEGTWILDESGNVTVTLVDNTYNGVYHMGWDDVQQAYVPCITALSASQGALWAMKATGQ